MTEFQKFSVGEQLRASRLNEMVDYSRAPYAGVPSYGGHIFGSQYANGSSNNRLEPVILVYATEDFSLQVSDAGTVDDVASGLCNYVRLNRSTNSHEDILGQDFYVHDVLGSLMNSATKNSGDVFYAVWNFDSKRWEALGSSGISIQTANVRTCLGQGWYVLDICDWDGAPYGESLSESIDDLCDPCDEIQGYADSVVVQECETVGHVQQHRETCTETGLSVYGHTCGLLPLKIDSMVKIIRRLGGGSISVSASESISEDRLYDIIDPCRPLLSLPFPVYECCVAEDGSKSVQVVGCNHVIVEGVLCDGGTTTCAAILGESESV